MALLDPGEDVLRRATQGDLAALDRVLLAIQPGLYNLSVRMLGNRDDAADATQEILLKVVIHLGSFKGQAAFTTWVWSVARNHLLTAKTRSAESPEISLEAIAERLEAGLDFVSSLAQSQGAPKVLTPEDKAEARQVALACTQNMLMALSREQRLVYVLDTVFDLSSKDAADILGIPADTYRQKLSRARAKVQVFAASACGLVDPSAACRCEKQAIALRHSRMKGAAKPGSLVVHRAELLEAERHFAAFSRVGDAAAIFRAHPDYQAPEAMRGAIRAVLTQEGFLDVRPLQ